MLLRILILLVSAFYSVVDAAAEWETNPNVALPPGMTACPRSDPNLNVCVKQMLQTMIPNLKHGYEPFGLGPIDPYFVKSVNFNYRQGNINIRTQPRNLSIAGFSSLKVRNVRVKGDENSLHLEIDVSIPKLHITGVYRADGNFNQVKVKAKGRINITVSGITTTLVTDGAAQLRNGEKYMTVYKLDTKPKVRGLHFDATGLFPDREFNNFVLQLINQNWEVVYETLVPEAKPIWEPLGLEVLDAIIGRVPYKRISPP